MKNIVHLGVVGEVFSSIVFGRDKLSNLFKMHFWHFVISGEEGQFVSYLSEDGLILQPVVQTQMGHDPIPGVGALKCYKLLVA